MRGLSAEILDWSGGAGHVLAQGERWQARGEEAFAPGETRRGDDVEGLTLDGAAPADASSEGELP